MVVFGPSFDLESYDKVHIESSLLFFLQLTQISFVFRHSFSLFQVFFFLSRLLREVLNEKQVARDILTRSELRLYSTEGV